MAFGVLKGYHRHAPPDRGEPRIEPLNEPPGTTLLLPDTSRQPLGICNSGVAQRHQVIPELTLPFLPGQTEHGANHWQAVSLPGPHDFHPAGRNAAFFQ